MGPIDLRPRILAQALKFAGVEGWSGDAVLERAAGALSLERGAVALAFPGGVRELAEYYLGALDREMVDRFMAAGVPDDRVRERIETAVRIRIELFEENREAVRRLLAYLALPSHAGIAMRTLYRTVDCIWRAAGDTATDFNFYTKRGLLAGVYGATVLFWVNDESPERAESWAFLHRRIENVMALEGWKAGLRNALANLPFSARVPPRASSN